MRDSPESMIAELAVFATAHRHSIPVEWFPPIPATGKEADLALSLSQRCVFVEVTVLTQGVFWDEVDELTLNAPTGTWTGTGPGFRKEAHRISAKVAEELNEVSPGSPNVLIVVFSATFPSKLSRPLGFTDALEGPMFVPLSSGSIRDFSNRVYVDSIFEIELTTLKRCYISPDCFTASRLTDEDRLRLTTVLYKLPFAFP